MKSIFKFALALLCFAAAQSSLSAQVVPGRVTLDDGVFYNAEGRMISDDEAWAYFGKDIYGETYVGARRQYKAGRALVKVGIPVTAVGLGMLTVGWVGILATDEDDNMNPFVVLSVVGGMTGTMVGSACLGVGIPFWSIGASRLHWIENNYNSSHAYKLAARPTPYLSLHSGRHGVGLALNF